MKKLVGPVQPEAQGMRDGATLRSRKRQEPRKLDVFLGSSDDVVTKKLPRRDSNDIDSINENTGNLKHSEIGGHLGGQFGSNSDSVAGLRQQALTSLQLALRDIRRMESLSDDPAESVAASRALAFVERAIEELEVGK